MTSPLIYQLKNIKMAKGRQLQSHYGQPRKLKSDEHGQRPVLLLVMNKLLLPSNMRTRAQIISETSA